MNCCPKKENELRFVDLPETALPPDFANRLIARIRRRKRVLRLQIVCLSAAIAVIVALVVDFRINHSQCPASETEIISASTTAGDARQATNLLFFGFFREYFRRLKSNRKKEENE